MSPRMPLLGLLMRGPAYGYQLKQQVAAEFGSDWRIDFAQLYRSLAKLEEQGLARAQVEPGEGGPERKRYTPTARGRAAFTAWMRAPAAPGEGGVKLRLAKELGYELPLLIAGSDDPLLGELAEMGHAVARVRGSTMGLTVLADEAADAAAAHLREPGAPDYNVSFVEHMVPEQDLLLVNLAEREYGLMVAPGNPKDVRGVRDLARAEVRWMNRTHGAGARLWLFQRLRAARLDPTALAGWARAAATYEEIAEAIGRDELDTGPGLRATARAHGLEFIGLGEERFDLILPREVYESARGQALREDLESGELRARAEALGGYDLSQTGHVLAEIRFGQRRKR